MLVIAFVFINLFIAVILEGFEQSELIENSMMNNDHLTIFKKAWLKFDPLGSGFITTLELRPLLASMPPPLGFL
jgi:Ca2+-binding EF-hand superfamily protein